jgi:hypothetical protein
MSPNAKKIIPQTNNIPPQAVMAPPFLYQEPESEPLSDPPLSQLPLSDPPPLSHDPESDPPPLSHDPESDPLLLLELVSQPQSDELLDELEPLLQPQSVLLLEELPPEPTKVEDVPPEPKPPRNAPGAPVIKQQPAIISTAPITIKRLLSEGLLVFIAICLQSPAPATSWPYLIFANQLVNKISAGLLRGE